ncbi:MAG: 3-phosphoshikimate 1-carboxyvinyltransferase [Candidatus Brocadiae bacterium]|nr:3-phosphoshikimate 1-carboxyvinyltransferase [Candidatus Brocadiia bacterium]
MAPEPLPVVPSGPLDATVRVPGSKSWTQRALCLAALADGESTIRGWGDNEDVRRCAEAVERLGAQVGIAPGEIRVRGPAQAERAELDLGGSGTAFRFMIGLCLALPGDFLLDGNASLRARPIGPLARAASDLGAAIRWMGREGYPPLRLASFGLTPKRVLVDASVSSQFLSALLIAGAAVDPPGLSVRTTGPVASASYVDMTVAALRAFGVRVHAGPGTWTVSGPARPTGFDVEPDATGANYFFGAAAAAGGRVRVEGVRRGGLQGDLEFLAVLERMGCRVEERDGGVEVTGGALRGVEADFSGMPDSAQTFAVLAVLAAGESRVRGASNLQVKETDRLNDTAAELRKLGAEVETHGDGWTIRPAAPRPAVIDPHGDHRMAMAFALAGLRLPGIAIADPAVVGKSFPGFWDTLSRVTRGGSCPSGPEFRSKES